MSRVCVFVAKEWANTEVDVTQERQVDVTKHRKMEEEQPVGEAEDKRRHEDWTKNYQDEELKEKEEVTGGNRVCYRQLVSPKRKVGEVG